mgnify:CR=1 FL=1
MRAVQVVAPTAKAVRAFVPADQLSLAIGKEGQNARLAARLTGWRIDIRSETGAAPEDEEGVPAAVMAEPDEPEAEGTEEAASAAEAETEAPAPEAEAEAEAPAETAAAADEPAAETPEAPAPEERTTDEEPDVDEGTADDEAAAAESTEVTQ